MLFRRNYRDYLMHLSKSRQKYASCIDKFEITGIRNFLRAIEGQSALLQQLHFFLYKIIGNYFSDVLENRKFQFQTRIIHFAVRNASLNAVATAQKSQLRGAMIIFCFAGFWTLYYYVVFRGRFEKHIVTLAKCKRIPGHEIYKFMHDIFQFNANAKTADF